jgi:hypothetical protein
MSVLNPNDIDVWAIQDSESGWTLSNSEKTITQKVLNRYNFSGWCIVWKLEGGVWVEKTHITPKTLNCFTCGKTPTWYEIRQKKVYSPMGKALTPAQVYKQVKQGNTDFYCQDHTI